MEENKKHVLDLDPTDEPFDDYDDNEEFQKARGEAIEYMDNMNNKLISDWCKRCKYYEPVGYRINYSCKKGVPNTITIHTRRPGVLIGPRGRDIEVFQKEFSSAHYGDWEVKFSEVDDFIIPVKE